MSNPVHAQEWLTLAGSLLEGWVRQTHNQSFKMPAFTVTMGFPTNSKRTKNGIISAECWQAKDVANGVPVIFIHPAIATSLSAAANLLHEIGHVVEGAGHHPGTRFERFIRHVKLEGPLEATLPSLAFEAWVNSDLIPAIGKYEAVHSPVILGPVTTQKTYMKKASCQCCGHAFRATEKNLEPLRELAKAGYNICVLCLYSHKNCRGLCHLAGQSGSGGTPPPPNGDELDITPPPPSGGGGGTGGTNGQGGTGESGHSDGNQQDSAGGDGAGAKEGASAVQPEGQKPEAGGGQAGDGGGGAKQGAGDPEGGEQAASGDADPSAAEKGRAEGGSGGSGGDGDQPLAAEEAGSEPPSGQPSAGSPDGAGGGADSSKLDALKAKLEAKLAQKQGQTEAEASLDGGESKQTGIAGASRGSGAGQTGYDLAKVTVKDAKLAAHNPDMCPFGEGCPECERDW